MNHILKCTSCAKYSLEKKCKCGGECHKPKPPKFSPEDKYGDYRRKHKEQTDDLED